MKILENMCMVIRIFNGRAKWPSVTEEKAPTAQGLTKSVLSGCRPLR